MTDQAWRDKADAYLAAKTTDEYHFAAEGLRALSDENMLAAYDWALSEQCRLDSTYASLKDANLAAFKMLLRQGRKHEAWPFLCSTLDSLARKMEREARGKEA